MSQRNDSKLWLFREKREEDGAGGGGSGRGGGGGRMKYLNDIIDLK